MKKVKGQPITGAKKEMRTSTLPTGQRTNDAEPEIKRSPEPFANAKNSVNVKAPGRREPERHGTVGVRALPSGGPIGQVRPISHKGSVFGKLGTAHPKRKGSTAFYGE